MSDDDNYSIRNYQNLDLVYKEQKTLVNGITEFRYQIPPADSSLFAENTYRYLVLLDEPSDSSQGTPVKTLFFSVKGEGYTSFPLVFGIAAAIAGGVAFLTVRKRREWLRK